MTDDSPFSIARLRRDEDIRSFFRGFETPLRLDIEFSPRLTPDQKRRLDADLRFRMSLAECLVRSISAMV